MKTEKSEREVEMPKRSEDSELNGRSYMSVIALNRERGSERAVNA